MPLYPRPVPRLSVAVLAVLVALLAGCGGNDSEAKPAKSGKGAAAPTPVLAVQVRAETVALRLRAVGNVEAAATVAIKSRVDGQIVKVHFRDGEDVAQGQLLFQIDPRPFQAQLEQAQANLLKNQAQFDYLRGQEQRYLDLMNKNFVSREAYSQVRTNMESARAAVAADEAAINSARLQLQYATIRAPIGGRAGKVLVTEGNLVKANDAPPLVVINQIAPVHVAFAVAEQHGPEVRAALRRGAVKVEVSPSGMTGRTLAGELAYVDNAVDPSTGTLKLRARFANREQLLWPGDFVEAALILREDANATVIPAQALQNGPRGAYVFVIGVDQTVEQRPVFVSRFEADLALIGEGLSAGETVVTDGASRLTNGAKVSVGNAGRGR